VRQIKLAIRQLLAHDNVAYRIRIVFVLYRIVSYRKMAVLGQNRGRGGAMLTPTNSFLFWGLLPRCHFSRKSIKKYDRESADRETDREVRYIPYS